MATEIIDRDLGWKKITGEINKLKNVESAIGLFGNGNTPESNLAYRMSIHEWGVKIKVTPKMRGYLNYIGIHLSPSTQYVTIPERSVFRHTFDTKKGSYSNLLNKLFINGLTTGKMDHDKFIKLLSTQIQSDLQDRMTSGNFKSNHPVTVERKGSSKPLVDTGNMNQALTYKIRKRTKDE